MVTNASVPERPAWRFRLGIASFVAAFAVHLITLAAVAAGVGPAVVSAIAAINFALNKLLLLATVAFLGRDGFERIKTALFGTLRRYARPDAVGPVRYGIGLVLFVVPIALAWISPYLAEIAPSIGRNTVRDGIVGDVALILGLLLLGGDFWDKVRALFNRKANVTFPG